MLQKKGTILFLSRFLPFKFAIFKYELIFFVTTNSVLIMIYF